MSDDTTGTERPRREGPTDLERLGGVGELHEIMADFIDRVFADDIIGFLFIGKDRDRILRLETELAANVLGRPTIYTGRHLGAAHKPLQINRGHFRRRLAILKYVLRQRSVPQDIVDHWIAHQMAMEKVVTNQIDCTP